MNTISHLSDTQPRKPGRIKGEGWGVTGGEGEGLLAEMKKSKGQAHMFSGRGKGFPFDLALVSLEGTMKKSSCSSRVETTLAAVAEAQRL